MSTPDRLVVRSDSTAIPLRVETNDGHVTIEPGGAFEISRIGPGTYRVTDGTDGWRVYVTGSADRRWVFLNGEVFEAQVDHEQDPQVARPGARSGAEDALTAPMPATVVRILVRAGQAVQSGDTLIVLEAMKMELPVRAPRNGTIGTIKCEEGELVQPGVALVEFE